MTKLKQFLTHPVPFWLAYTYLLAALTFMVLMYHLS